jgi:type I restriction enzyme S subunit
MLTATHVRDGFVSLDGAKVISESDFRKAVARCGPENGDVLIVSVGATTGRAAIVENCSPFALVRSVLLLKPLIDAKFLLRWLQTPWCLSWMRSASEGSAQPHLYIGDVKRMPIPILSLGEQRCIVRRVDELMAACDRLESQIEAATMASSRLLETLIEDALAAPTRIAN